MKISKNTFYKLSLHILFLMFISCDETIQESCPEPKFGDFISIVDKGEMTIDYIEGLKPSYGLPDDFEISYDIKIYSVDYKTTDPNGNEAIASGAIYIPMNTGKESLSLVSGQHGLTIQKSDVASLIPALGYLGVFGASIGYAVIQPDYLGLGNSDFPYYPVYQKSNGKVLLDMVDGVNGFACENDIKLNDNLFLIGYSNGGYNSIAMHEELSSRPRDFDIDASVVIAGYYDLEREKDFKYPEVIETPAWAIYHSYVIDKTYNLNIIDKIIQKPYVDKLDDLFSGEYSATYIDQKLTRYTEQLFTHEFLNEYETLEIFDDYKKAINSNSLMNANIIGDIFLIHSKEDEVVPYGQSQNLFESIKSKGGNAELVLLEKGKHSPQDYVMSVVDALKWLERYD
tara:strand:- start:692 stop:1888 length:1197 start_codon:yes stop_codon:yes gene_type:complete